MKAEAAWVRRLEVRAAVEAVGATVVKTAFGRAAMAMAAGTTLAVAAGSAWTVVKLSLDDFEWAAG